MPNVSKLIIVDSAQIEARILAWLAGQQDMIQAFAENRDIYSEFGAKLFGARLRKPKKSDPPSIYSLYSIRRGFAKDTILGSGFGLGPAKFYQRCLENPGLRPLFDSGQYDQLFVQQLIKGYRTTYSRIPALWKSVERCFRLVIKYPHEVMRYAVLGSEDLLTFWNKNKTVNIQLPSGRVLYYPKASISRGCAETNDLKYYHGHLWGGSLVENIVQAIARDLLVHWILETEKAGLPVVLHVHDEIIAVTPAHSAEENLQKVLDIVSSGPEWAEGLPLAAEGIISNTYTK